MCTWPETLLTQSFNVSTVCKYLSVELEHRLDETGRSKEQIELGHVLDRGERKRKINYHTSYVSFFIIHVPLCTFNKSVHAVPNAHVQLVGNMSNLTHIKLPNSSIRAES